MRMSPATLAACLLHGSFIPAAAAPPAVPPPGTLTLAEGKFGKALDARSSPVEVEGSDRYRRPPLTVECWAKLLSKRNFNVLVASDPKTSADHWEIYSYALAGAFSAYLPGMQPSEIVAPVDICDGKWHYLAMTYDGKEVRLFVDGKQVKAQAVKKRAGRKADPGPLGIGAAQEGKQRIGCDGFVDEVRISSTLRKIEGVPAGPLALDQETVGLWRFDHPEAADVDPAWTPRPAEGAAEPWERATDKDWIDARFQQTDTGPFLGATFEYEERRKPARVFKGTAIRVGDRGEAAVLFDRNQLRLAAGWTGGYLQHSSRRFALLNTPKPAGPVLFSTEGGPGWADAEGKRENKHPATAPLPPEWAKYKGLYLHGKRVVLSYTVGKTEVLESPWVESRGEVTALTRTLEVGPSDRSLGVLLGEEVATLGWRTEGKARVFWFFQKGNKVRGVGLTGDRSACDEQFDQPGNRAVVRLEVRPHKKPLRLKVYYWEGDGNDRDKFARLVANSPPPDDLRAWTKPGPARWTKPIVTRGEVGKSDGPFAVDTLTVPYDNPHKALFFVSGVDFLPTGEVVICTAHGDVWLVKGVDEKLEKLTWKRFATGLYQPLGLKVVDGNIFVLERGQLTRLHDLNDDGEADFYENFNGDWHTAGGEHSFDTCLETDPQGRFYFFKTGDTETPTGGCLLRVAKDGSKAEVFATGFRHPIGLGVSPTGLVTGADQEGNWMPSTRVDVYKEGGFYGDMRAHHRKVAPATFDPPLCWLPRQVDNSAGGQVWVPDGKWGPLSGQLLHLSYGRCSLLLLLRQEVDGVQQAGAVDLGLRFLSGVARGRFHPRDGHLYLAGLNGWQTAAARDGCVQRVRHTGKKLRLPVGLSAHANGLQLTFSEKLDRRYAEDVRRYRVEQWNYRWSGDYGSRRWSVAHPDRAGQDAVPIKSVKLSPDGRSVFLETAPLRPVMQMQVRYGLTAIDGAPLAGVISNTIHRTAPPP